MSTALLDQFGRPVTYQPASSGIYEDSQEQALRLARPNLDADFKDLLSKVKFKAMLSDARWIYTTFPLVSGAIGQKSDYVSSNGWEPKFTGQDKDYEARTRPIVKTLHDRATNKGWSATALWRAACRYIDFDGSVFLLRHRDSRGYPIHQPIEAHRIGVRDYSRVVRGGRYDGAPIVNGIIYSSDGREIAYNVLGATSADDRQISAAHIEHICDPSFFSEARPFPKVAFAILDWYDIKETRGFQKIHNKANSALSIIETNELGQNVNINAVPGSSTQTRSDSSEGLRVETLSGGLIRYIKSGHGAIQAHESASPSDGWLNFDQTIVNGAMYGIGWRSEMMDLSRLTGAGVRGFADNINEVIKERHRLVSHFALRSFRWRWAMMQERGDVPEHPEWDKWTYRAPAEFDVDRKNTSKAELEEVRAGRKTMVQLIRKDGHDPEDQLEEQARYIALQDATAKKYGIDPKRLGTLSLPGDLETPADTEEETDEENATAD